VICGILFMVALILLGALTNTAIHRGLLSGHLLERLWTLIPGLVLVQVAVPSLLLLYTLDEASSRALTLKAVGHQWY